MLENEAKLAELGHSFRLHSSASGWEMAGKKNEGRKKATSASDSTTSKTKSDHSMSNGTSKISAPDDGSNGSSSIQDHSVFDFGIFFEKTLAEVTAERKSGVRSSATQEALRWFEGLPKTQRDVIEMGIEAITYRGAMNAAEQQYDSLVREAKSKNGSRSPPKDNKSNGNEVNGSSNSNKRQDRGNNNNRQNQRQQKDTMIQ